MTPLDQYIQSQVGPLLTPGEHVLHTSTMRRQPGLLVQMLLIGGLLLMLITKTYLVALTNRRLILILTKASFWSGKPKPMNLGLEEYDVRSIRSVSTSGFANNRSMTFQLESSKLTLRISPWLKSVSGTKNFFEQVPALINAGQLAAAPLPAPPAQQQHYAPPAQQQHYAPPAQQQHYAPPAQQQHYAPPAQHHAAPALGPGARVWILAADGKHYHATLVHQQGEHCLCDTQNGQYWYPVGNVSPA